MIRSCYIAIYYLRLIIYSNIKYVSFGQKVMARAGIWVEKSFRVGLGQEN